MMPNRIPGRLRTENHDAGRDAGDGCFVDALVVGGGLVGLAAAAFLAQQGVSVVLAERHRSTSLHPKARLVTVRSMEIYRSLGVEDEIRSAGEPNGGFAVGDSLADEHESWIPPAGGGAPAVRLSPVDPYSCDQQRIEPILCNRAEELGARLLFGTEVVDVDEDAHGVSARLSRDGADSGLRARFVIAADGAHSQIRRLAGIELIGRPVPGTAVSALFRADLDPALRGRHVDGFMARSAEAFLFARGNVDDRLWQLGTHIRPEWRLPDDGEGRIEESALMSRLGDVIRAATGLPEIEPRIEDVLTWSTGAWIASKVRRGRILFVGDAAHQMPPYGGFGGNTGVHDAHNLAWKIAAVCRGEASPGLLDTYETERIPIMRLMIAQTLLRSAKTPGQPAPPDQVDSTTLSLGFVYPGDADSPDTASDDATPIDPRVEDPATPSGRPGTRAPHVELTCSGSEDRLRTVSTLDLLDPTGFTLVTATGSVIAEALRRDPVPGITLQVVDEVADGSQGIWESAYSGSGRQALLIRPDQVIVDSVPTGAADPRARVSAARDRALRS
ncbi:FAD-binding protein [Brevibacterium permense]|uniref:FAD-dependent monooxygenase n=1 Tax=Brevibacterium permense TaxID=234834 RepID=UPI0021CF0B5B|nr:FAD-dependent monooxygenase [Brevibacterium permense]MCU4297524.1 FAD-binding protein [Brevibacterium permense]